MIARFLRRFVLCGASPCGQSSAPYMTIIAHLWKATDDFCAVIDVAFKTPFLSACQQNKKAAVASSGPDSPPSPVALS